MDVSIIVLNWNGAAFLEACLKALRAQSHQPQRIMVVDNASTDDSVTLVRRHFRDVAIIENDRNLGYAGGNNVALRQLETEAAVLVNPDIVASRKWLAHLMAVFAEHPNVGIAGCKLFFPGGQKLQHAGGVITHPRAMPGHRGMYETDEGRFDVVADVGFVTGAAIAVRRETMAQIGLLDEGFFMYFEDADWCERARRGGARVVYVPQATAVHDESAMAVRGSPSYLRHFHSGRWRYLLKHFQAEEILAESLAAEASWLEGIAGDERRALGWAYQKTVTQLPAIMAARVADGAAPISAPDQARVSEHLLAMRREAMLWPRDTDRWGDLRAAGTIEPQPFRSEVPLVGPLLARFRDLWASVAAKPYAGAWNAQQNEFNLAFLDELEALETRMMEMRDVWMKRESEQREVAWELAAIEEALEESSRLLASIKRRLQRWEGVEKE